MNKKDKTNLKLIQAFKEEEKEKIMWMASCKNCLTPIYSEKKQYFCNKDCKEAFELRKILRKLDTLNKNEIIIRPIYMNNIQVEMEIDKLNKKLGLNKSQE